MRLRIVIISFVILVICGYVFVKHHGFSARATPMAFEAFIARHIRHLSVPSDAMNKKNPLSVTPLLIAEARDHFADHCATCHGNKGDGKTIINEGLYPKAPDMRSEITQSLSDGEIFYIIKNGVRFTGMPGWGGK